VYLSWIKKKRESPLHVFAGTNKLTREICYCEVEFMMSEVAKAKHPGGRPTTGFPRWVAKFFDIQTESVQVSALAESLGITREAVRYALAKQGISVELRLENSHYCGYYETAKLHDLARRAIAREQDATKNSISVKNKEVSLCS
jgi:hypothetical protein